MRSKVFALQMLSNVAFLTGAVCYLAAAGINLWLADNGYIPAPAPFTVDVPRTTAPLNVHAIGGEGGDRRNFAHAAHAALRSFLDWAGRTADVAATAILGTDYAAMLFRSSGWLQLVGAIAYLLNPLFDCLAETAMAPVWPPEHLPNLPRAWTCFPWQLVGIILFGLASCFYFAQAVIAIDQLGWVCVCVPSCACVCARE